MYRQSDAKDSTFAHKIEILEFQLRETQMELKVKISKLFEDPNNKKIFKQILDLQQHEKNLSIRVKRNTIVDKIIDAECIKCESVQPPHTEHCNQCNRCVSYMDHHCPWVNNCVGIQTQKQFLLFNIYTLILLAYSICLLQPIFMKQLVDSFNNDTPFDGAMCLIGCTII